jgi:acyl-CoA synthetase (NDP forming)
VNGAEFTAMFRPRGIAVVGAGPELTKPGGRVLRHLLDGGYRGAIYPVNPKYREVADHACFQSIADVPDPVDLAVICVGAGHVPSVVRACGRRGIGAAVVHSDGFGAFDAPGAGADLREAWQESNLRVIGPNSNGLRTPGEGVLADASSGLALVATIDSPVAIITQSGGLGAYFGPIRLHAAGVGPRYLIDTGNEMDVDAAECLRYFADDPGLSAVGLILEGCRDGRRLVEAVRYATAAGQRMIMLKLAVNKQSALAAKSHTGAIAGRFDVFAQVLTEAGALVCSGPREFVTALALCGRRMVPRGPGIGVITGSGGFGVVAGDLSERYGLTVPLPTRDPSAELRGQLPLAVFSNPMDISTQQAGIETTMRSAVRYMSGQPGVDSILVYQPHGLLNPRLREQLLNALLAADAEVDQPLFVCGEVPVAVRERFWHSRHITAVEYPEDVLEVIGGLTGHRPVPDDARSVAGGDPQAAAAVIGAAARDVLATQPGIELVQVAPVESAEAALRFVEAIAKPVMLKGFAPGAAHKTELGLVLGPVDASGAEEAYRTLATRLAALGGGEIAAEVYEEGVELALGMFRDPTFGPVVMVSAGGRLVELFDDASFAPAPVDAEEAARLLGRLRAFPTLAGYRGGKRLDLAAAAQAVAGFSALVSRPDFPYSQADVNPLIVRGNGAGAVAVDYVFGM